jgi:hypothetical protein
VQEANTRRLLGSIVVGSQTALSCAIKVLLSAAVSIAREHLRQMIAETQELLKEQVAAIQAAFDKAVASYREIDVLFPEKNSG